MLDDEGKNITETVVIDGKEVTRNKQGNEQYVAKQINPGSFNGSFDENIKSALTDACAGDQKVFFEAFRLGWNELSQQKAAGTDIFSRTMKTLLKMGYSQAEAEVTVATLKAGRGIA